MLRFFYCLFSSCPRVKNDDILIDGDKVAASWFISFCVIYYYKPKFLPGFDMVFSSIVWTSSSYFSNESIILLSWAQARYDSWILDIFCNQRNKKVKGGFKRNKSFKFLFLHYFFIFCTILQLIKKKKVFHSSKYSFC